nr:thioesterase family protein [uncultured Holophaga sp.]
MTEQITVGMVFERQKTAEPQESAAAVGSGGLDVYSTPSLVALFEGAALQGLAPMLPEGFGTVGIDVHVKHLKATKIGKQVRCAATVSAVEGKKISFTGEMFDEDGKIGEGTHVRYVVNNADFVKRLG